MNTKFSFNKMMEPDAAEILSWRYEEPYSFYDRRTSDDDKDLQTLIEPTNLFLAVRNGDEELIAYYCFGGGAQIEGGDYSENALDITGAARPDLLGTGFAEMFLRAAMDFGQMFFNPETIRTTIPDFNTRALRICEKGGFVPSSSFRSGESKYIILTKKVEG